MSSTTFREGGDVDPSFSSLNNTIRSPPVVMHNDHPVRDGHRTERVIPNIVASSRILSDSDVQYEALYSQLTLNQHEKALYLFFYELYLYFGSYSQVVLKSSSLVEEEPVYSTNRSTTNTNNHNDTEHVSSNPNTGSSESNDWKRKIRNFLSTCLGPHRGFISYYCYILLFIQWSSLFMDSHLPWHRSNKKFFMILSVLANFKISYLWEDETNFWWTLLVPFLFSCLVTLSLVTLSFICFHFNWKSFKNLRDARTVAHYSNIEEHPQVHLLKDRREKLRVAAFWLLFHLIELIPGLFIPVSLGFLHAIRSLNVFLMIPSLILILPFHILSIVYMFVIYEWRFDTGSISAKSNTRLDLFLFALLTVSCWMHSMFQSAITLVIVMFSDFFILLIILAVNILFVSWYKTAMNITITILIFSGLIILSITSMLSVLKAFIPSADTSSGFFSEITISASIFLCVILGYFFTRLRLTFNELVVNEQTRTELFLNSHRNTIVIPRRDFEVEMATRTISFISHFVESKTVGHPPASSYEEVRDRLREIQEIERVDELFQQAMDYQFDLAYVSPYIYLSYSQFKKHAREDPRYLDSVLSVQRHCSWRWLDVRFMFYVRTRFWFECELVKKLQRITHRGASQI
ncbi:hypothetical protein C9374_011360 [Naegleria lovaniensis]|uniref:Uncharacterized protein n=1 Tax=Naegleria lovaniensis TaxID=51637 RepID=A0AA88KWM4_NAELO|nr:uncharacterized protein C9374_011360 [Naegleria lovaniensis]KAG2392635.1 hypothetical protein C9374_011360 [Naegleria lovaniensis]